MCFEIRVTLALTPSLSPRRGGDGGRLRAAYAGEALLKSGTHWPCQGARGSASLPLKDSVHRLIDNTQQFRDPAFGHGGAGVDFGHFLGNVKKKFGIKRERDPFVFSKEIAYFINGGPLSKKPSKAKINK